jgi:hypothetical protein
MHSSRTPGRAADGAAAALSRRRKVAKRIACAVIFCGVAVSVGIKANYDVQTTDNFLAPASIQYAAHDHRQQACIYDQIRQRLPEGARIYVNSPDVAFTQRLVELSTLWAVPQQNRASAKYLVSIRRGGCYGVTVEVRRI